MEPETFGRWWQAISSADLTSIALGMADLLCRRALEQAESRVQFPGLFWDEDARDAIGKFGAIKKMLADMAARRYLIETFVESGADPLAKAVAAEALGSLPGSITATATKSCTTAWASAAAMCAFRRVIRGSTSTTTLLPVRYTAG